MRCLSLVSSAPVWRSSLPRRGPIAKILGRSSHQSQLASSSGNYECLYQISRHTSNSCWGNVWMTCGPPSPSSQESWLWHLPTSSHRQDSQQVLGCFLTRAAKLHPLGTMNVCTTFHANTSNSCWDNFKLTCGPPSPSSQDSWLWHLPTRSHWQDSQQVLDVFSPESVNFILWESWMSTPNFTPIPPIDFEILSNWPAAITIHQAASMAKISHRTHGLPTSS